MVEPKSLACRCWLDEALGYRIPRVRTARKTHSWRALFGYRMCVCIHIGWSRIPWKKMTLQFQMVIAPDIYILQVKGWNNLLLFEFQAFIVKKVLEIWLIFSFWKIHLKSNHFFNFWPKGGAFHADFFGQKTHLIFPIQATALRNLNRSYFLSYKPP